MSFTEEFVEILNKADENVSRLFSQFDQNVKNIVSSKPYTTKKPDYRIKHPIHKEVFCEVKPIRRPPSLRVHIRVDGAAISEPKHSMHISDIVSPPTGVRWIRMNIINENDLSHALLIVERISKI